MRQFLFLLLTQILIYFHQFTTLKKIKIQTQLLYCIIKAIKQKLHEKRWVCIYRLLYIKISVLDRLKSYFNEYFSDATKPSARTLFLIVVSILTLDIFRSVHFAHRHVLSKISDTSLNAYLYALKTDRLDHEVNILLSFLVLADDSIRYLSVPLGYWLWDKNRQSWKLLPKWYATP